MSPGAALAFSRRGLLSILLVVLWAVPAEAAPSAVGGSLALDVFVPSESQWDIFTVSPERQGSANLTRSRISQDFSPAWSPDGRRLAYVSAPNSTVDTGMLRSAGGSKLVISRADGAKARALLRSNEDNGLITTVAWSPDGTRLVYTRNWYSGDRFLKGAVESIRLSDGRVQRLYFDKGAVVHWPQWSPDGAHILIERIRDNQTGLYYPDLLLVEVGGGAWDLGARRIWGWSPSWTPDGRILFTSAEDSSSCQSDYFGVYCAEIWVSDLSGLEREQLTTGPHDLEGDGWNDHLWRARMSPDGSKLAILVNPDLHAPWKNLDHKNHELWVFDLPAANPKKLVEEPNLFSLSWRPRCTVFGTRGDDVLRGTPARDLICGLGGDDLINGLGGNDVLFGHGGNDRVRGGPGADIVVGNAGRDRCDLDDADYSRVC